MFAARMRVSESGEQPLLVGAIRAKTRAQTAAMQNWHLSRQPQGPHANFRQ